MGSIRVLATALRGLAGLGPLLLLVLALASSSCREKASPFTPDTTQPSGPWSIELRAPQVMYRDTSVGHVINDTIVVRVYNAEGRLTGGAMIRSQASVSRDSVTPIAISYGDSTTHWWGCNPALIYWGSGGPEGQETVHSWVVVSGDTVAETSASFKVMDSH